MTKKPQLPKRRNWRAIRGRVIPGILFEIDTEHAEIRIKRGRCLETYDLKEVGIKPADGIDK